MPVKMPKSVKVSHYNIPVIRERDLKSTLGQPAWGIWDHNDYEILVEKPIYSRDKERETLLHEIMHSIVTIHHLPIEMPREEEFVGRMSLALLQLMRDNPKLMEFLLDK